MRTESVPLHIHSQYMQETYTFISNMGKICIFNMHLLYMELMLKVSDHYRLCLTCNRLAGYIPYVHKQEMYISLFVAIDTQPISPSWG